MSGRVNGPRVAGRSYDSSGRRRRAAATRDAVVVAAREAFLEHGYAATSITAVASAAGVSPELIYKTIGAKPALLKAVLDTSVVGDTVPTALQERPAVRAMKAMTDPARVLTDYAGLAVTIMARLAPIYWLARDAAITDPAASAVVEQMNGERLTGMAALAAHLIALDGLKPGFAAEDVRDILWMYNSPEMFELLVRKRHWSTDRYRRFLADALTDALLHR